MTLKLLPTPTDPKMMQRRTITDGENRSLTTGQKFGLSIQQVVEQIAPSYSQADFPANHSLVPESERERKMTATSGQKCCELLKSLNLSGLLERIAGKINITAWVQDSESELESETINDGSDGQPSTVILNPQ